MLKKIILKILIFAVIILVTTSLLSPVLLYKAGHRQKLIQGLYDSTQKTVDVVYVGSSHMNGAISPDVIWDKYGITGENYATGGQPIEVSYYLIKEILKTNPHPVVVLDVYYLGLKSQYGSESYCRYVLDNMKFSYNKLDAIFHCVTPQKWLTFIFPFFEYHSRWSEIDKKDFTYDSDKSSYYAHGFSSGTEKYGKESKAAFTAEGTAEIPEASLKYLNKIISLSKEKNFTLVFVNMPHDYSSTENLDTWVEEPAKMFNTVQKIADENGIDFINFCTLLDEVDFDFKTDMKNSGHVNIYGAHKLSEYMGKYLSQTLKLTDHRGDSSYAQWDADTAVYKSKHKDLYS